MNKLATRCPHPAGSTRLTRRAALPLIAAVLCAGLAERASANGRSVSLETARAEAEAGRAVLIDIREPREHAATGVAAGAKLLPMQQLKTRLAEIPTDPSKPVLLICNTQNRSSYTLNALRQMGGYEHVRFVEGGMSEWVRRGWPTVRAAD